MRNPFRKKALTATPDVVSAIRSGWTAMPMLGSGSRSRITAIFNVAQGASNAWRYQNSPAVRTVIDRIVFNVGQLELRLYKEATEDKRTLQSDHAAALSVRYPTETGTVTSDGLIRGLFLDWLINDNAYAILNPNGVKPGQVTFRRVPPYMVEVQGNSLFEVENYRLWPEGAWGSGGNWGGAGTYIDIPPQNMLHWHGEHPTDPRVGLSKLETLAAIIAEDAALQAAITELANSGMTQPVWAFRPENAPELTPRTRMMMEEDFANRLVQRNRKPIVLEEGTEFRSFGVSPQDAQMMEVRRWCVERVAAEFGVPLGLVGLEGITPEARTQFLSDVLAPACEHFTRMLDARINVAVFDDPTLRFAFDMDEKFAGDSRLATFISAVGAPIYTRNEGRAVFDLPPVPGGDEIVTPMNVTFGDPTKAPKPSVGVNPIQDPNKPPQDGSYRQDQGQTPIPSNNQGAQKGAQKAIKPEDKLPQYHPRRSGDMQRQEQAIPQVERVVRRHLKKIGREYTKSLETRNGHGEFKSAADWQRWTQNFTTDLLRVLKKITLAEANTYMFKLAGGRDFDMNYVQHYLEAKAQGSAQGILEKFRTEISDLGLDTAQQRIDSHAAGAGGHLAVTSMTFARESAARQAPGYERRVKSWIADTSRHAEFDGQTIPVDAEWPQGFGPGQEPNCRCSTGVE